MDAIGIKVIQSAEEFLTQRLNIEQENVLKSDHFGVAVNLSRIKYIISHINGHWIPTGEVQIRFAEFCPPVKFYLKMACNLLHGPLAPSS